MEPNPSCVSFGFVVSPTKFVDIVCLECAKMVGGGSFLELPSTGLFGYTLHPF
jgi:hypothetical protein